MNSLDRLLNVTELAEYLGLPVATLYQWRHRREGPPGFRVGRHIRYRLSDVQEWIEQQFDSHDYRPNQDMQGKAPVETRKEL